MIEPSSGLFRKPWQSSVTVSSQIFWKCSEMFSWHVVWRYKISLLVLKNISLVRCAHLWNIFQREKRNFISASGPVISFISYTVMPQCHAVKWENLCSVPYGSIAVFRVSALMSLQFHGKGLHQNYCIFRVQNVYCLRVHVGYKINLCGC